MKKNILLILILISSFYSHSQCQKGDCKNGFSTMKYSDGTYEGYYKDGKLDSLGYMFYADKRLYHGEFNNNQYNGNGYYKWKSGSTFFGKWKNGLQSGLGIEKNASGTIVSAGEFLEGKITKKLNSDNNPKNSKNCTGNCVDGIGKLMNIDSINYLGIFKNKKIILGRIQSKSFLYDGEIKNNVPNGYGQIKYLDTNEYFMGYFKNGKKHGAGIYTNKSNKKVFGEWVDDIYQDPTIFTYNNKDFCDEIIALAKLTRNERKNLEIKKKNYTTVTLEKQFLNNFNLDYENNFNGNDKIFFRLPEKSKEKVTIKYQELIESCNKCKKLTNDSDSSFSYKDVKLYVSKYSSGMTLTYPKPDPCISGNCKNGKGKKQYTTSVYEGQFKDNKAHGKGKETWESGNWYEGEFENDLRNGKGQFYWAASGNKYDGEYKDGFRTGYGKFNYKNGNVYTGNFVNNKFEGQGTFIWNEEEYKGQKYEGEFKNDLRNGQGTYTWANGSKYIGMHKENKFTGEGKEYSEDGKLIYEGNYLDSKFEGHGTRYYNDGKYIGEWKNDKRNGKGIFYNDKGKISYDGQWKDDKFNGTGTYYWENGNKYSGDYIDGVRSGKGTYIWASGYYLIGEFKEGKFHGNCIEYYKDGKIAFEGEYKNGKADGYGKLYDKDGKIKFEGQYKNGEKVE